MSSAKPNNSQKLDAIASELDKTFEVVRADLQRELVSNPTLFGVVSIEVKIREGVVVNTTSAISKHRQPSI